MVFWDTPVIKIGQVYRTRISNSKLSIQIIQPEHSVVVWDTDKTTRLRNHWYKNITVGSRAWYYTNNSFFLILDINFAVVCEWQIFCRNDRFVIKQSTEQQWM